MSKEAREKAGPKSGAVSMATVNIDPLGAVTVTADVTVQGQSHETVLAQIVAKELGLRPDDVDLLQGIAPGEEEATADGQGLGVERDADARQDGDEEAGGGDVDGPDRANGDLRGGGQWQQGHGDPLPARVGFVDGARRDHGDDDAQQRDGQRLSRRPGQDEERQQ